jgi:probable phosphoglycerate mutase
LRPATTFLLLIRHGENEWVSSGRLAGRTPGVHLNDKGRDQAKALAELLQQQPIRAIYASPLERCIETAEPLAKTMGLPILIEPGVIEVDYGDWHGKELKELGKQPEWQHVQHFPSTFRFPGGETLREVQQRVVTALEELAARHPNETIVVVSHGDVIRTAVAHFAGTPLDLFQRLQVGTGTLTTIALTGGRPNILNINHAPVLPIFENAPAEEPPDEQVPETASLSDAQSANGPEPQAI